MHTHLSRVLCLSLIALAGAPASAQMQYQPYQPYQPGQAQGGARPGQVGDGRLLDRPLGVGQTSNYQRPDLMTELRLRNAIVTGNAPGGASFRGDVGYSAPGDFRGALGSDDLYAFRRDTTMTGLAGQGYRGTEALQYMYGLSTANTRSAVSRLSGTGAEYLEGEQRREVQREADITGWTQAAAKLGTLRQTGAYEALRDLRPSTVGTRTTAAGIEQTNASPLLGVSTRLVADAAELQRLRRERAGLVQRRTDSAAPDSAESPAINTAYDQLRARLDLSVQDTAPGARPVDRETPAGATTTPDSTRTPTPDAATPNPASPAPGTPDASTPAPTAPDGANPPDFRSSLPGAQQEPRLTAWERRMLELRSRWDPGIREAMTQKEKLQAAGIDVNPFPTIDQAVVKMLYDAGADITFYVQGEAKPGDLYSTHMADAQSAMKAERYFDAEEHFGRALSYKPGDVTALMGRAHAQIGAGLLISASANLRSIFEQHPELIAARFSGEAGIPEQRANDMIAHLRRHLVPGADPLSSVPKETGLLLAYLGFQRSDTAAINNGLDVLMRLDEDIRANKPDAKPDALHSLLRAVWLYGVEPANLP